jgi:hypothetical protein
MPKFGPNKLALAGTRWASPAGPVSVSHGNSSQLSTPSYIAVPPQTKNNYGKVLKTELRRQLTET